MSSVVEEGGFFYLDNDAEPIEQLRKLREENYPKALDFSMCCNLTHGFLLTHDPTEELASAVIDTFRHYHSKHAVWHELFLSNCEQNVHFQSMLSEARGLFPKITLASCGSMTPETACTLRDITMKSKLERLTLQQMTISFEAASILRQGLLTIDSETGIKNLELRCIQLEVDVDEDGLEQNATSYLAQGLSENKSLTALTIARTTLETHWLTQILEALVDHPTLQELSIEDNHFCEAPLVALGRMLSSPMCRLAYLDLSGQSSFGKLNMDLLVRSIRENTMLQTLDLSNSRLENDDLTKLSILLCKCPNLLDIDLSENLITRLDLPGSMFQPSKLRQFDMDDNPVVYDPAEEDISCLLRLVDSHPELGYVGVGVMKSALCSPHVQYLLDLNRCGRVLLKGGGGIPLSVWPLVLERAIQDENFYSVDSRRTNVLYQLLKGPALAGRGSFP
jgi:hypothetical protein